MKWRWVPSESNLADAASRRHMQSHHEKLSCAPSSPPRSERHVSQAPPATMDGEMRVLSRAALGGCVLAKTRPAGPPPFASTARTPSSWRTSQAAGALKRSQAAQETLQRRRGRQRQVQNEGMEKVTVARLRTPSCLERRSV